MARYRSYDVLSSSLLFLSGFFFWIWDLASSFISLDTIYPSRHRWRRNFIHMILRTYIYTQTQLSLLLYPGKTWKWRIGIGEGEGREGRNQGNRPRGQRPGR
ncbi:hypothetical protein QBC45DRAFT_4381 [Copromyces sp. CBS 386.78]|nr:hypothetical protein QBC45DRAFT_4381 [Copromyces sp. CBS 386.78]